MKNSKFQTPNSKRTAGQQLQAEYIDADTGLMAAWEEEDSTGALILRDGPVTSNGAKTFALDERTARFGEMIIRFSKKIPRDPTNNRLIDQIVGAATSVGANYMEASESVSKKDFRFSISRCVKEAKETGFFLRMIAASEPSLKEEARQLYREARELVLILASMYRK